MANRLMTDVSIGARNLLQNCVGAQAGHTLLIIGEEPGIGYYDDQVCETVSAEARALGIDARILRTPLVAGPDDISDAVVAAMQQVDHTVFFSRLGDQIRFTETHGTCTKTMCYALDMEYLGSEFSCTPWQLYKEIHDRLLSAILSAKHYRITCPLGTDLHGGVPQNNTLSGDKAVNDFTVNVFPVVIYPPLSCVDLSGSLVLDRFLLSTSINRFENSVMPLPQPVIAKIENNRIIAFEGDARLVARIEQQYRRVGALSGGDPFAVNSWHTGMYPKTFYSADPQIDTQRWGDLAFASPRYTHFHTCGTAPGNIASATFDTTISFDNEIFWDAGRLAFLDRPEQQALLEKYPDAENAFEMRWDIGL